MTRVIEWAWFLIGLGYSFSGKLELSLGCFIMSKLYSMESEKK